MSYYAFIEEASFACKPPLKAGSELKFPVEVESDLREILEDDLEFLAVNFKQHPEKGWICHLSNAGDSQVGNSFGEKLQEAVAYLGENFATEAFLVVHINDDQTFHENRDTEYVGGPSPQAIEAFLRANAVERSCDLLLGAGFSQDDVERMKAVLSGQHAKPALVYVDTDGGDQAFFVNGMAICSCDNDKETDLPMHISGRIAVALGAKLLSKSFRLSDLPDDWTYSDLMEKEATQESGDAVGDSPAPAM